MARSIVISADYRVSQYLEVLLKSIFLASNGKEEVVIYILNYDYPTDLILHYIRQCQLHLRHCQIKVLTPTAEQKQLLNNLSIDSSHLSKSIYYKLFLVDLLPNEDSVLFLDPETLVIKDLAPLLNYPMADNVSIYACPDYLLSHELKQSQESQSYLSRFVRELQGQPHDFKVFSTHVMLLNLKRMRQLKVNQTYINYLASNQVCYMPHVSLFLNLFHQFDWQALPDVYNYQVDYISKELHLRNGEVPKYAQLTPPPAYNLPYIVSYTGINKPLNSNKQLPFRRLFMELYIESISEILLNRNVFDVNKLIKSYSYLHLLRIDDNGFYQPIWH
ncbi:hypothetical protein CJP74_02290 [Psittacicella melopsittaci]|uniref:Glycosyl transferase family 8 n=1 Tax=Psittacicella melopsittaci TaxID=2028576 RepID=A0A3A1Y7J2_9GAMM|nr:glycosyltransferase [Psittacicella melopsittaci]RIY33276.1 hypothetical protein CJP74_02290 [Psittacicella melopsittaci]